LQPESDPVFMQLARRKVNLEGSKAQNRSRITRDAQWAPNCEQSSMLAAWSKEERRANAAA